MRGDFCVQHWFTALKHHSALWRETRTGLPASLPHFGFGERAGDGEVHVRSLAGRPGDLQLSPCFRMDRDRPVKTTEARCPTRHNSRVATEQSLDSSFPVIPHELMGVDCCGCIIVRVATVEIMKVLLGIGSCRLTCPTCGRENTFLGFSSILMARCSNCDAVIETKAETGKVQQRVNPRAPAASFTAWASFGALQHIAPALFPPRFAEILQCRSPWCPSPIHTACHSVDFVHRCELLI